MLQNQRESSPDLPSLKTRAYRMVLLRLLADTTIALGFLYLGQRTGAWQLQQSAAAALAMVPVGLLALFLIRKERPLFASVMVISALPPAILFQTSVINDVGIVLGLSAVLVTTSSSLQALPARQAGRMMAVGIITGVAALLMDEFLPSAHRLDLPATLRTFIPMVLAVLVVAYAAIILRSYASFSLRAKLIFAFVAVTLLPLSMLAYVNDRSTRQALTESANQALFAAASKTANSIDTFINSNLFAIQTEAELSPIRALLSEPPNGRSASRHHREVSELLEAFLGKDVEFLDSYWLLDREGRVVASTKGVDVQRQPLFLGLDEAAVNNFRQVLLTDIPSVSPVRFSEGMGFPSFYFAARVSTEDDQPLGLLVAIYNASILQLLVEQNNDLAGADSFGVLFDEFQIHLAHGIAPETIFRGVTPLDPDKVQKLKSTMRLPDLPESELFMNLPELSENLSNVRTRPFFSAEDIATGDKINQVAVARLETQPWSVAFFQPREVFLEPAASQSRITLVIAILIASLAILAAIGASQLLSNPINRLTLAATEVTAGDLTVQAAVESGDEIGALARAFNTMTNRLRETLEGLEETVAERTRVLERRALQLEIAAQVSQEAASIRDITELLQQTVHRISNGFGFYQCGIFMIEDLGEFAVLKAASSEGGRRMLQKGHRLRVGRTGIVGHVAAAGEPRIALDVGADAVFFDNPDLPITRSEMALPLKVQEQVIGVLDVQSHEEAAFTEEDVRVLQIVADQIALAIENARLLNETREALRELEGLYKQQVEQAWQARLADQKLVYHYDRLEVRRLSSAEASPQTEEGPSLRVPIDLRGRRIGWIRLRRNAGEEDWSVAEKVLLDEIASQVGVVLDNARLMEEIQLRAHHERTINEMSAHFSRSLDVDDVLRAAVRELGSLPQVEEVAIFLQPVASANGGDDGEGLEIREAGIEEP